jgi:serine/threonine-protein kinase RsbW
MALTPTQSDTDDAAGIDVAATTTLPQQAGVRDEVTVRLPAEGAYLSVLRMVTAGLAARLDFTIDEMEDLKIAVDEACAMLLSKAVPGGDIHAAFALEAGANAALSVEVTVATLDGQLPSRDTFSWTVLTALAGEVDARTDADGHVTLSLRKTKDFA